VRLRLLVVPTAHRQIRAAASWWVANRPAARGLFRAELARAFDLITLHPDVAQVDPEAGIPGIRRFLLSRVHYHLYYRHRADLIEVVAVWHATRGTPPDLR
jgi:plasmid stabilization system protein ParE